MTKIYAMEYDFLARLIEDRREIMEIARSLGTAEEMRIARADFLQSIPVVNITPKTDEEARASYRIDSDGNAHIPIVGELTPRAETDVCGGYTAEALTEYGFIQAAVMAADADDRVSGIVFDVNSPGGYVDGVVATADAIRGASKPTESIVHGIAASAAYWLASQTDKITAANIGVRVGSIGVAREEFDDTQMLENAGITRRVFTSTEAPDKRLDTATEEGQVKTIAVLDDIHEVFARYVAEGRGVSSDTVNSEFGRGGMVMAEKASQIGMIDAVIGTTSRRAVEQIETPSGVTGEITADMAETKEEGTGMDIQTLKTEHSEVFAEAVKFGVEQERARQSALDEQLEADPGNSKLAEVIKEAKASGATVDQVQTKMVVAIRDWKIEGENPPEVATAKNSEKPSDEDVAAANAVGMTVEDYLKFSKEAN